MKSKTGFHPIRTGAGNAFALIVRKKEKKIRNNKIFKFTLVVLILNILCSACQIAESQSRSSENANPTPPSVKSDNEKRWEKEKLILSNLLDNIERKLKEKDKSYKTMTKTSRKPPEYTL